MLEPQLDDDVDFIKCSYVIAGILTEKMKNNIIKDAIQLDIDEYNKDLLYSRYSFSNCYSYSNDKFDNMSIYDLYKHIIFAKDYFDLDFVMKVRGYIFDKFKFHKMGMPIKKKVDTDMYSILSSDFFLTTIIMVNLTNINSSLDIMKSDEEFYGDKCDLSSEIFIPAAPALEDVVPYFYPNMPPQLKIEMNKVFGHVRSGNMPILPRIFSNISLKDKILLFGYLKFLTNATLLYFNNAPTRRYHGKRFDIVSVLPYIFSIWHILKEGTGILTDEQCNNILVSEILSLMQLYHMEFYNRRYYNDMHRLFGKISRTEKIKNFDIIKEVLAHAVLMWNNDGCELDHYHMCLFFKDTEKYKPFFEDKSFNKNLKSALKLYCEEHHINRIKGKGYAQSRIDKEKCSNCKLKYQS